MYENHCIVQRLLEQIQYQHETASKLEKELHHEKTVLEERLKVILKFKKKEQEIKYF